MFDFETDGLVSIGLEQDYLQGHKVVLGLADYDGTLIGYFGDRYHSNHRGSVDEIGEEAGPVSPSFLVIGLADENEEVIGWFGSSFLKSVGKAITTPVKAAVALTTAPVRAAVAIAKGKPVGKTLASTFVKPVTRTVSSQLALAKPVLRVAAPVLKSPVTKAITAGVALAFPPVGIPVAAGVAAATAALPYVRTGVKIAQAVVPAKPAPKPAPKPAVAPKTMPAMALATADKVLAAAKGTLPAQKTAPKPVAQALQTAAKKSVAATYARAKQGDADAQRGLQVLVAAKKIQAAIPAAQSLVPSAVTTPVGSIHEGNLVTKDRRVVRGRFQKAAGAGSGTTEAPVVLKTGVVIKGSWKAS